MLSWQALCIDSYRNIGDKKHKKFRLKAWSQVRYNKKTIRYGWDTTTVGYNLGHETTLGYHNHFVIPRSKLVFVTYEFICRAGLTRFEWVDVECRVQLIVGQFFVCQLFIQHVLLDGRQLQLAGFDRSCDAASKNMRHGNDMTIIT